jgi:hypothetical protein
LILKLEALPMSLFKIHIFGAVFALCYELLRSAGACFAVSYLATLPGLINTVLVPVLRQRDIFC